MIKYFNKNCPIAGTLIQSDYIAGTLIQSADIAGTLIQSGDIAGTLIQLDDNAGTLIQSDYIAGTLIQSDYIAGILIQSYYIASNQIIFITETSPCAIGNFCKWLLYKCSISLSSTVIQTNIKFLKITVTWSNIW